MELLKQRMQVSPEAQDAQDGPQNQKESKPRIEALPMESEAT
jgi:hypothetical protein